MIASNLSHGMEDEMMGFLISTSSLYDIIFFSFHSVVIVLECFSVHISRAFMPINVKGSCFPGFENITECGS